MEHRILIVGDVMLDHYIIGDCHRISPEAPVPVVSIKNERYSAGGAANLALNLSHMGSSVDLFGVVGHDKEGQILHELLLPSGITNYCFQSGIATTEKTRIMAANQQMIRLDREDEFSDSVASCNQLRSLLEKNSYAGIIVSDYAKGLCSVEVIKLIQQYCKEKSCRLFVDPKGNDWTKYSGAYLIKPNLSELETIAHRKLNSEDDIKSTGNEFRKKLSIEHMIITQGRRGMIYLSDNVFETYPVEQVEIYDVSGAGDTAMAALCHMLSTGHEMAASIIKANKAAAYSVSKLYTHALSVEEARAIFSS